MGGALRVGIAGWRYAPWRGVFYPRGLRQADELAYAADRLTSIELNGSFYALQRPSNWTAWRDVTPDGFVFAVKGPRYLTHILRLRDPEQPLANFFASGLLALGPKLGPILWQFPPSLAFDRDRFAAFLSLLPRTTAEAVALARRRDERMTDRDWFATDAELPIRHAIEPRHPSFDGPEFARLAAAYGAAIVLGDSAGRWPVIDKVTTDFVYARLHGDAELYASGYDDPALDRWAAWTRAHLDAGRDVHVYFDNDLKVRAPFDAMALIARLRR